MKQRDYQRAATRLMVARARKRGKKAARLLLVSPTGSGKTVFAVAAIKKFLAQGKRVLFVAHTQDIVDQTYRHLLKHGLRETGIGVLMASDAEVKGHGERVRPNARVQVCGVQTLARREAFPPADVVIIDEAHHAPADSYQKLVAEYPRAAIFGLTATPQRRDGKGLGEVFGELYTVAQIADLIRRGYLARPVVYSAPANMVTLRNQRIKRVSVWNGEYNQRQLDRAMSHRKLIGNIVAEWKRLGKGRRTVVFASSIAHSKAIAARFRRAGVRAEHIDGTMDKNDVQAALGRLDSGATAVVCNYGVLAEGWDQPSVKCIVLARPTRSLTVYLQQAGRSSRPYRGHLPIVLDHAGNAYRHGLPDAERSHSLDGVERPRGAPPVKTCAACRAIIAAGYKQCPECGNDFPRAETPEETRDRLVKIRNSSVLHRLRRFAKSRGLPDKWISKAEQRLAV